MYITSTLIKILSDFCTFVNLWNAQHCFSHGNQIYLDFFWQTCFENPTDTHGLCLKHHMGAGTYLRVMMPILSVTGSTWVKHTALAPQSTVLPVQSLGGPGDSLSTRIPAIPTEDLDEVHRWQVRLWSCCHYCVPWRSETWDGRYLSRSIFLSATQIIS